MSVHGPAVGVAERARRAGRLPRLSGLQVALLVLGLVGLAEGLAFMGLHLAADHASEPLAITVMQMLVGWAFLGVGLFAWMRRPDNRVGAIMTGVGLTWFLHGLVESDVAAFATAGLLLQKISVPLAFSLLAFPTGRLGRRRERQVVAGAWVFAVPLTFLATVLGGNLEADGSVDNLLAVTGDDRVNDAASALLAACGVALAVWMVVVIALRWRDSTIPERRELLPIVSTGGASAALFGVMVLTQATDAPRWLVNAVSVLALLALAGLPFGFLLGLARARVLAGRAVSRLVEGLGAQAGPDGLRALLADALRDPSVEVAYWVPEAGGYVDVEGRVVDLPARGSGRSWTAVERDGAPVAAIVHDPALDRLG